MAVTQQSRLQAATSNKVEHMRLLIGNEKPGAVMCEMHLVVSDSEVTGVGCLTQTTNPPLSMKTYVTGTCTRIIFGGEVTTCITLNGCEFPTPMQPNPMNMRNMQILLDSKQPQTDCASYCYLRGEEWCAMTDQRVALQCLPCD